MSVTLQCSLLDGIDEVGLRPLDPAICHIPLTAGAWIDIRPGWLTGADELFTRLAAVVPWHGERRQMYHRQVDVPRLLCFYDQHDQLPDPVLGQARRRLNAYYTQQSPDPLRTAGLCYYRDGADSVACHGDTIGAGSRQDTVVAIISLGAPRALLLRPRGGTPGRSIRHALGHGDLLVMGGSCQRTWEHAVPKTARAVGPRISIQFRPRGVR
jgi:alkylated DNA repair dioxygenase AlkB